ncbi:hypothetical protein [Inquilinus limosus]|uniref:Uncharacterized protein n=1 Tax=Inquilinus limosus MP06 TaxID=1398085 RepID=A0A0A0DDP3_9PROT|nr:hypothetical protein [Inquilinus limosus]KGM36165.1 hypothetical protein P409_00525 [Inquilinus limosus MP06]
MNVERLTELVRLLREPSQVPGVWGFWMGTWYEQFSGVEHVVNAEAYDEENNCGTTCCAMGLAGLHKSFQDQGLTYDPERAIFAVDGRRSNGFDAAAIFFDIPFDDALAIFDAHYSLYGTSDPSPEQVANVIERYIVDGSLP